MILPSSGIQNIYSPILINGKVVGNVGAAGAAAGSSPFTSMFQDAVENVQTLEAVKTEDNYNLAVGDMDDLAAMMMNSERSQVALQLLIEMRNKVLDSYSEIMRMNV